MRRSDEEIRADIDNFRRNDYDHLFPVTRLAHDVEPLLDELADLRSRLAIAQAERDAAMREIGHLTRALNRDNALLCCDAEAALAAVRELRDTWHRWPGPGRAPVPWVAFFGHLDRVLAADQKET
jgi:hypothetical protein